MTALFSSARCSAVFALFVAIFTTACSTPPKKPESIASGDYESTKQYISQLIQYVMREQKVTGLSIALVDDQRVVWAQGFGFADAAKGIPATAETTYRVGSISKLLTATLAMQLEEQGRLDIDKPIQTYLPTFSVKSRFANSEPITARNLMTHHSGLPDNLLNGMWCEKPLPFKAVVDYLKDDYVAYPPNFIFSYSNIGVTVLGNAIEQITGQDFSSYANQNLLAPVGMRHSSFSVEAIAPFMSKAYRDGDEVKELPLRDVPAGGLNSNVQDLARFMEMVFAQGQSSGKQIIKPATLNEMFHPQNENVPLDLDTRIGLAWYLAKHIKNGGIVLEHGGTMMYHRSEFLALPEKKLGVIVLANSFSAGPVVKHVAAETLKIALEAKTGIKQPKWEISALNDTDAPRQEDIKAYSGHYATLMGPGTITNEGDRLRARFFGRSFDFVPAKDGQFGLRYRLLGFIPIERDNLKYLRFSRVSLVDREVLALGSIGNKVLLGEKIKPQPIPQSWIDRQGEYDIINSASNEADLKNIELRNEDGFLFVELNHHWTIDRVRVPILPVSDSEAIVMGLGRGKGETIRVVDVDGEPLVAYAGYLLRKRRP